MAKRRRTNRFPPSVIQPLSLPVRPATGHVDRDAPMTCEEARRIVAGSCWRKSIYQSAAGALASAHRLDDAGHIDHSVSPYRCQFTAFGRGERASRHWHLGSPPSIDQMHRIAAAMRWLREHPDCLT